MSEWRKLGDVEPGSVFVTHDGVLAVKSEYYYSGSADSQCECVLLASGEYAHFSGGNGEMVRVVDVATGAASDEPDEVYAFMWFTEESAGTPVSPPDGYTLHTVLSAGATVGEHDYDEDGNSRGFVAYKEFRVCFVWRKVKQ